MQLNLRELQDNFDFCWTAGSLVTKSVPPQTMVQRNPVQPVAMIEILVWTWGFGKGVREGSAINPIASRIEHHVKSKVMVATGKQSWLGRLFLAIFAVLFLSSGLSAFATTWDSDGTETNVQALLATASDGDTITLPAGTFSWTSRLEITKGITLRGETTITGAGTSNPQITDATIIKDDTPRSGAGAVIIKVATRSNQSFRLTGITFSPGRSTTFGAEAVRLTGGDSSPTNARIDHCHFASLYQGRLIFTSGWVYGVADHNVMEVIRNSVPFFVAHPTYGGANQINGNGSWADYPWYGTEKFFFIEDNTIIRSNNIAANSLVDCIHGGRWVTRHNYLQDVIPGGHGTEGGVIRGQRVNEFYNNTVKMTVGWSGGGQRSGTSMWHDNTFTGVESKNDQLCDLANFRQTSTRADPIWGFSDGTSPWDMNDTDGNGTYVEGHPPFLFASGSATSGSTIFREQATFSDSTKNWTPNQWVGYSIKNTNPASASYRLGSYIISNDAHSISYAYNRATNGGHLLFNPGDTYEIHRVLVMMDQNGRGKGDQITAPRQPINRGKGNQITAPRQPINRGKGGPIMGARKPPVNARTGTSSWPQQALEPCYSWNNIYTPNGHAMGYGVRRGQPTTKLNVDFFNLGAGFPADSTPSQVSSRYTAALNGVDYVGTFVYPHPLVSGNQRSPSSTRGPSNNSQKNEKLKRRKEGQKLRE
jgi:hypothetical protein